MIKITPEAAEQIRRSASQSGSEGMPLRIAARVEEDGSIAYGMGFDQARYDDVLMHAEGIEVVVAEAFKELMLGASLDYVEISPGEFQFIFQNPNDPSHRAAGITASSPTRPNS